MKIPESARRCSRTAHGSETMTDEVRADTAWNPKPASRCPHDYGQMVSQRVLAYPSIAKFFKMQPGNCGIFCDAPSYPQAARLWVKVNPQASRLWVRGPFGIGVAKFDHRQARWFQPRGHSRMGVPEVRADASFNGEPRRQGRCAPARR